MRINFKKVTVKNFLSFGNKETVFDYEKGVHAVTGHVEPGFKRNGVGKCLRGDTEILIEFEDEETYNEFLKFIAVPPENPLPLGDGMNGGYLKRKLLNNFRI